MSCCLTKEDLSSLAAWLQPQSRPMTQSNHSRISALIEDFQVFPTVREILSFTKAPHINVALQFPQSLLWYGPLISEALRIATEDVLKEAEEEDAHREVFYFLLGDTSYGECCVDEVSAQHLSSDLIVHYGNACLSRTRTLPVLFVYPKFRFDDAKIACVNFEKAILEVLSCTEAERIVIMYDDDLLANFYFNKFQAEDDEVVEYCGISSGVTITCATLRMQQPDEIITPNSERWDCMLRQTAVGNLAFEKQNTGLNRTAFVWFTRLDNDLDWSAAVRNAALQLCTGAGETCAGFYYASLTTSTKHDNEPRVVNASHILRKRMHGVSKVKQAQRIGIVPGTLGIHGCLDVIERCKKIIGIVGKRSYVILVGKPNVAKLANFPDIDLFVLVACPNNSLLDGRDYLRPIVTPLELEAGLLGDGDIFTEPFSADFRDVLRKDIVNVKGEEGEEGEEEGEEQEGDDEKAVGVRGDWSVGTVAGGGAEYLRERLWKGLTFGRGGGDDEVDVEDLPTQAVRGRSGIASGYEGEGGFESSREI